MPLVLLLKSLKSISPCFINFFHLPLFLGRQNSEGSAASMNLNSDDPVIAAFGKLHNVILQHHGWTFVDNLSSK